MSLPAARRHPCYSIIGILICRKAVASGHEITSLDNWAARLDGFLEFNGNEILTGPGKISAEEAKLHAETEYEKYRIVQDRLFESDFDRFLQEMEQIDPSKAGSED